MKYRKLGDSDLEVSEISPVPADLGLGGGLRPLMPRRSFAQGINFIDTANVCGRGAAEAFFGGRSRVVRAIPPSLRPRSISR
jgi:aryl-alcohol dehydrogenase-like predicted oxidoreductase